MKTFRKRMIALAALACVAFTTVASGCSSKDNTGDSNSQSEQSEDVIDSIKNDEGNAIITPFQTGRSGDNNIVDNNAADLNAADPTVTTAPGGYSAAVVTEIVTVTGADGQPVTDAKGNQVTEIVTRPASTTNASQSGGNGGNGDKEETTGNSGNGGSGNSGNSGNGGNSGNSGNNGNEGNDSSGGNSTPADNYISATDSMYCLWIDISKDEDFLFEDEFIRITFQIKDNIPDRDYPINISPDFSSVAGLTQAPDLVKSGTIRVGSDIEAQDVSSETGFVTYGDNISCKQGDTVDYYINVKNNPGIAAMLVWFYYDANAMDIVEISPAGQFAEFAVSTQTGTKPDSE